MPEVTIEIGGRSFQVACQAGEEPYLLSAAKMLDEEAAVLAAQVGRIPEARMLLMAGLMLADKTASLQGRLAKAEAELAELRGAPRPDAERIEVPVVPDAVIDTLAEIAARAEALADTFDPAGAS
ncbi:MAG: cell division protein ZapA [Roseovarius sp.]|nr:cell division protein ZapA [Roseovarius sp.]